MHAFTGQRAKKAEGGFVMECVRLAVHLDVAVVALGHKRHVDGEEVIGLARDAELHAATFVVGIDDG